MRRAGSGLILGTLACALGSAVGLTAAFADWVPPFKGNDTGGIIAWSFAQQNDARQLAIDHCARYGKVVKRLAAQRYDGGYLSFACVWRPPVAVYPGAVSVKG